MRLGMFMMPLHPAGRPMHEYLAEDTEKALLLDRLGYDELFIGEHYSAATEPYPSPMMFAASLLPKTERLVFGTGVINAPLHHPAMIAAEAAQFDHLSKGRFILGIGTGSTPTDIEMMGAPDRSGRARPDAGRSDRDDSGHLGERPAVRVRRPLLDDPHPRHRQSGAAVRLAAEAVPEAASADCHSVVDARQRLREGRGPQGLERDLRAAALGRGTREPLVALPPGLPGSRAPRRRQQLAHLPLGACRRDRRRGAGARVQSARAATGISTTTCTPCTASLAVSACSRRGPACATTKSPSMR